MISFYYNLKLKYTVVFGLIASLIGFVSLAAVYYFYISYSISSQHEYLKSQGVNLLDYYSTDSTVSYTVYHQHLSVTSTIIFQDNKEVFVNSDTSFLRMARQILFTEKEPLPVNYRRNHFFVSVFRAQSSGKEYVIATAIKDTFFVKRKKQMLLICGITFLSTLLLSFLLGGWYARVIQKPIGKISDEVNKISGSDMRARVSTNYENKVFSDMAHSFNNLMERVERSFAMQKSFVHHASHELRTPLASMLAQTESALGRKLDEEGYRRVLESLKEDQHEMIDLANSLLLISQYENLKFSNDWPAVRLDEVVYETIEMCSRVMPDLKVILNFDNVPEDESELAIKANEPLIRSAVRNLIKNAYNYSDNRTVYIYIDTSSDEICINFQNSGRTVSPDEQEQLFIPFFRGQNSQNKKGFGLGLSIVSRITAMHLGKIKYKVTRDGLNCFTLTLKKKKILEKETTALG